MRQTNFIFRLSAALLILVFFGFGSAIAASIKPLALSEKSRVVANKQTFLIVVLDLKQHAEALKNAGSGKTELLIATSASYAKEYLDKAEFRSVPKAVVYLISVDSMDEYNRANFNGMKRFGTLTFERKPTDVVLVENKLNLDK